MQQFRTTVSAVFWTETPDESQAIVAALTDVLAPEDQTATIATVEYIVSGRPVTLTAPSAESPVTS
jgi:hypothetical protein